MARRLALLVLVLAALFPAPVSAQETPVLPRANGDLLFAADFSADTGGLAAVFDSEWMTFEARSGVAVIGSQTPGAMVAAGLTDRLFGDFLAEVDVAPLGVRAGATYGLYFRSTGVPTYGEAMYSVFLDPYEGTLQIKFAAAEEGDWQSLQVARLAGLPYDPNGANRLRLEAVGDRLTVFLNGSLALVVRDARVLSGQLGLALGAPLDLAEGETLQGSFDNLRVYAPGAEAAPPPAEPAPAATPEATPAPTPEPTAAPAAAPTAAPAAAQDAAPAAESPAQSAAAPAAGLAGSVTAYHLNVRSGPGARYSIAGTIDRGNPLVATGRNPACGWLFVTSGALSGWVNARYVRLEGPCSTLPTGEQPAAAVTAAQAPAAAEAPAAVGAPAAATAAESAGAPLAATITDFEQFGTWRRGDEPWGTFVASREQVAGGRSAGKLAYDIPANVPGDHNYVVFLRTIAIPGSPDQLALQVYGDGSGSLLNAWVTDAGGQVWQFAFGAVNHRGWQQMVAPLDTTLPWPVSVISGDTGDTTLDYPLRLRALVLDYPGSSAHAGVVYLDNLVAITEP